MEKEEEKVALHIHMGDEPEPLYALYDEKMEMWISKRGHCTQMKYAKFYTKVEAEAIQKHMAKNNIQIRIDEVTLP